MGPYTICGWRLEKRLIRKPAGSAASRSRSSRSMYSTVRDSPVSSRRSIAISQGCRSACRPVVSVSRKTSGFIVERLAPSLVREARFDGWLPRIFRFDGTERSCRAS